MTIVTPKLLSEHDFLHGMSAAHLAKLAVTARYVEVPGGHRFFEEGGRADRFWLIHAGEIGLDVLVPWRGRVIVETFGRGAVLGWSWLFPPYQWRFGAVARQPVRAIEFDGTLIRTLCAADPSLGYELTSRFISIVFDRLQATRVRMLDVYAHPGGALWPAP